MFKVQFRDATDHDRVLVDEIHLQFDPRLSPVLKLRKRAQDYKHNVYQVVSAQGVAEIVTDEPEQSGIIVYLKEIRR